MTVVPAATVKAGAMTMEKKSVVLMMMARTTMMILRQSLKTKMAMMRNKSPANK
jgi:hypothetical protein